MSFEAGQRVRVKSGTCEGWIGTVDSRKSNFSKLYFLRFDADKDNRVGLFEEQELELAQ